MNGGTRAVKAFAAALREIRKRMGLTQEDLARLVGVERSTVTKWESGQNEPPLPMLAKLADVLGVPADELLGRRVSQTGKRSVDVRPTDPELRRLEERTGVPARLIAAFIVAVAEESGN